jgi:flavodoxin
MLRFLYLTKRSGPLSFLGLVILQWIALSNSVHANALPMTVTQDDNRVLIVYLTRTQNTAAVANFIQQRVGGKLVEITLITPYPEDYAKTVEQVRQENASGFLPPLATQIDYIEDYQSIFVGFPTWGMELPPPIKSFIVNNDLSGKRIIPFNTNAGYGVGSSIKTLTRLCEGCLIEEVFSVRGGEERQGIKLAIAGQRKQEVIKQLDKWLQKVWINKTNSTGNN